MFWAALHALDKGAERFNLRPKQQVSKLSVGEENDEEHDGKAQDVFSTTAQCGGQLGHGLVKTDVLENLKGGGGGGGRNAHKHVDEPDSWRTVLAEELSVLYLDPGKEQVHCVHVVVLRLPEGEKLKISVDVRVLQQFAQQVVHFDRSENIKRNGNHGELQKGRTVPLRDQIRLEKIIRLNQIWISLPYHDDDDVQYVPDASEVGELVNAQLKDLLHHVVEDEHAEDHLTAEDEIIPGADVSNELDCPNLVGGDRSAGRGELDH